MPTKTLTSPADRNGLQDIFKFGGGADTITALDDPTFDFGYIINAGGGNDIVTGSSADDVISGGTGSDTIVGGLGDDTIYGGEDETGTDAPKGHNAILESTLIGDVEDAFGLAVAFAGGNDHVFGSDGGVNDIYGDTRQISFSAATTFTGGNDELVGGDSDGTTAADNNMYGDASNVGLGNGGTFLGGIDTMTGGSGVGTVNDMYGDARLTSGAGTLTGGADVMTGGADATNNMYGDAIRAVGITSATGGDDTLTGGSGANATNNMYGDFDVVTNSIVTGGNDTIIAAAGATDNMYGDWDPSENLGTGTKTGGDDTFVIGMGGGTDTIFDFELAEFEVLDLLIDANDVVDLTAFGAGLDFAALDALWTGDTITFSAGNTLTFDGLDKADFSAEDFIFAA